jgi:microcystin degradation protein MlrC
VYPGKAMIDRVMEWQQKPRVIDVSFFFGFAWSDVHQLGVSAVAVTDNAPELARVIVDDLAGLAWSMRDDLTRGRNVYSVAEGVALAIEKSKTARKPIVLLDHADRMNETSFVLRELVKQDAQGVAFPLFYDPEAVQACMSAGEGNEVTVMVGGKTSPHAGGPVPVKGKVVWLGDKTYIGTGPMRRGRLIDNGPTAIVQAGGIWLQLVSKSHSLIDEDAIIQYGRRTDEFKIIVTKSKTHFRAVYEKVGEEIITVDAPAYSPVDLRVFDYTNVPRGVYPVKS